MKLRENKILQYAAVIITVLTAYVLARAAGLENKGYGSLRLVCLFVMVTGMIVLIRYFRYLTKGEDTEAKQVVGLILILGVILRITYMLYTPCTVRSNDLWELDTNSYGHAAYILNIMLNGQLPPHNFIQFYQQPLFYLLGAAASWVVNGILGTFDNYSLVDATKTVSCIASCVSLLAARSIFMECGLSGKGLYKALIIIAFLPAFFLSGGKVAPDALVGMFMILALLYTIRWMKDKSWKNTILLALIYGCGVMTKISCATLAVGTAFVFLISFINAVKKKAWQNLLQKYVVFGMISLPLGLWYSVRNYILFRQPLNYVLRQPDDGELYTGYKSIAQRILVLKLDNLFADPYTKVTEDYNLPVYALKSSLFGEFRFENWGLIVVLLLMFAFLLSAFCVIAVIRCIRYQRKEKWCMFMLLAAVLFYGSIALFYLGYPSGCSMDFRYMLFLPVPMAYLFGKCELFSEKNWERYTEICCLGFAAISCMMYC